MTSQHQIFEPPPPRPDPEAQLAHIAELSQNARATWFGLLGLLAFVGVTLLAHKDADFFAKGAATQLPLVGITVPVESFFLTAPVLVTAVYAYLHLHLITLWDALAEAPAKIGGQPLSDRVYPWLISYAALWERNRRRRDGSAASRTLGWVVIAVSIFLGWVLGLLVLAGLWWRSMAAHNEWLTLSIALCFWVALIIGVTGFLTARARMANVSSEDVAKAHWLRRLGGAILAALLAFLSWETTEGGLIPHPEDALPPLLVSADLSEAELTPRPADWKPFGRWLRDLRRERELNDPEQDPLIPTLDEIGRWHDLIAGLDAPNMQRVDLRDAIITNAFLPGADLRRAEMQGAYVVGAQMQGANLEDAKLRGADLRFAELQGADLLDADLRGAILFRAKLQGAILEGAAMRRADLDSAELLAANLENAWLEGTNLIDAQMQGAKMIGARMQGADLSGAEMQGANLSGADLQESILRQATLEMITARDVDFRAADLRNVSFKAAELEDVHFEGANLQIADFTGATLWEVRFQGARMFKSIFLGATIYSADFRAATLTEARFVNTSCDAVDLRGAVLHSAKLDHCLGLNAWKLSSAVGNGYTQLPDGLSVPSCHKSLPEETEALIKFYPEAGEVATSPRELFLNGVLCSRDAEGNLLEEPRQVGRYREPGASR